MIKHAFVSPTADDTDESKIQPSDWNDAHVIDVIDADPLNPSPGDVWMLGIGAGTTTPRQLQLKFCDPLDGVVVTLLSVVR